MTVTEKLTVTLDESEVRKLVEEFIKSKGYEVIDLGWDASNWRLKGCIIECKPQNRK